MTEKGKKRRMITLVAGGLAAVGGVVALLLGSTAAAFWLGVAAVLLLWLGLPSRDVPAGMPRRGAGRGVTPPGEEQANLTILTQPDPSRPSAPMRDESPARRSDYSDPREHPP